MAIPAEKQARMYPECAVFHLLSVGPERPFPPHSVHFPWCFSGEREGRMDGWFTSPTTGQRPVNVVVEPEIVTSVVTPILFLLGKRQNGSHHFRRLWDPF